MVVELGKKVQQAAVITGGGHRIGRRIALALAQQGYIPIIHYHHSEQEAKQTVKEIEKYNVPARFIKADLTQNRDIDLFFNFLDAHLYDLNASLKILVNSASSMNKARLDSIAYQDWDGIMNLNLRAPFFLSLGASRRMPSGSIIVNISDVAARKLWTNYPLYVISKSGLEVLTRLLAKDLAPNIRVNAIAPGLVLPSKEIKEDEWARLVSRTPMKMSVPENEIVTALLFLIETQTITGHTLILDSGYSLIT